VAWFTSADLQPTHLPVRWVPKAVLTGVKRPEREAYTSPLPKCLLCLIVNDDQQDATILAYLFIHNQLYMFRAKSSPIIGNTLLYLQVLKLSTDTAAGWFHG
jgi:hypothetical protein